LRKWFDILKSFKSPLPKEPEEEKEKQTKPNVFFQGREFGWPGPGGSRSRRLGSWLTRWRERG
jgi:hypothetical protein